MADTYWYETALNVPFDGANGSQVFTDLSLRKWPLVAVGAGPQISTAQSKFAGGSSLSLSGAAANYVNVANMIFNTGRIGTVEMHVRFNTVGTVVGVFSMNGSSGSQLSLFKNANNTLTLAGSNIPGGLNPATTVAANTWYHVAMVGSVNTLGQGIVTLYLDGTSIGATTPGAAFIQFDNVNSLLIGRDLNIVYMNGYIDNLRITPGIARYTANFTQPAAPYDTTALAISTSYFQQSFVKTIAAGVVPATTGIYLQPGLKIREFNNSGSGRISGTTKIKGTPTNQPVSRRVRLYGDRDGILMAEQWSDATTGNYSFDNNNATIKYTVITYDHTHGFRAVVADNLTPDPMP